MVKGWTAFTLGNKPSLGDDKDPYPSLPNHAPSTIERPRSTFPQRAFRDLVVAPCSSLCDSSNINELKELHPWADVVLLKDVLGSVEGDIKKASLLLKEMSPFIDEDCLPLSDENVDHCDILKEPEFEEERDVYLIHRRIALKEMREASRHSKAAKSAFMRGDHMGAKNHSLKAKEKWVSAEEQNSLAGRQILKIRNESNGLWILDLHGLHKSEATRAVFEHLQELENLLLINNNLRMKPLQIVTGVGNHGRGEAVLPVAVKVFLHNNGYQYNDTRPGVILVWPKYRRIP